MLSTSPGFTWEDVGQLREDPDLRAAELLDGGIAVRVLTWLQRRVVTGLVGHLGTWCAAEPGRGEVAQSLVRITGDRAYLLPGLAIRVGALVER